MKLTLLRHGQSQANHNGLLCGRMDSPLTQKGMDQAMTIQLKLMDEDYDYILSSPLDRAHHTARIARPEDKILIEEGLQEIDMGEWEGVLWSELTKAAPEQARLWLADPAKMTPPGGENTHQLFLRVAAFVDEIINKYPKESSFLMVSHGGVISSIAAYLLGGQSQDAWRYLPVNCGLIKLDSDQGYWILKYFGE